MVYSEFTPHAGLQQIIKCFWVFENKYGADHFERMIPDGFIDLVYHYGQKPKLILNGREIIKPSLFLGGHLTSPALLKFSGELKMFGIKFFPWASASLYKNPAYELNDLRVPVSEILGNWVNDYDALMFDELNKGNFKRVIHQLESILLKKLPASSKQEQLIKYCFEKISGSNGNTSIEILSKELGYSARFIQKLFNQYKGKPFQYHCRLSRLHYALHQAQLNDQLNYTRLAYEAGYYDQSHFIKDFTSFTGLSPSAFFAEENSYIQQHAGVTSRIINLNP